MASTFLFFENFGPNSKFSVLWTGWMSRNVTKCHENSTKRETKEMRFPLVKNWWRAQILSFDGPATRFTEQIVPNNSVAPKRSIFAKNVTKCHEISHSHCMDIWSPPRRFYAATTLMFEQHDLQALEWPTWRLPDINFSENSFPEMDLGEFQFWSDEMVRNLGTDGPSHILSGCLTFFSHLIRPKLKLTLIHFWKTVFREIYVR